MRGLTVHRLVKGFDTVKAVDDVSFNAGPGEFISLLGPSGCGKTTTLRCIAGFERPTQGRIAIDGEVVVDADAGIFVPPDRRRLGMVFQSYAVWPHMTVLENVSYPLKVQGGIARRDIVDRARAQLKMVGLLELEGRFPAQLSGGQQQRVALARALVMEPRLLLFDEPLSNLDATLRERMRFELMEIQHRLGVPAVYVTHDQSEAMVMSRRIVVMDRGKIAQEGTPPEIYRAPTSRFVAGFIGLSNFIEAEVLRSGDGRWTVRSALGEHQCVSAGHHRPGETVLLALRPERILLEAPTQPGWHRFSADIRGFYFMGPHCEYMLDVGGTELRVQTSLMLDAVVGDRIEAYIGPADCRVVADDVPAAAGATTAVAA